MPADKKSFRKEGIESSLKDEIIGTRCGGAWRPGGGVKLMISDEYFEKGKLIVEGFEKSRKET